MYITTSKGSKPFTFKAIIIVMSLLYVLGPVHLEINKFLHTIAHTLEMPDTILTHQSRLDTVSIHQSKEHKNIAIQHDHEVIELVERILEGVEQGSESPNAIKKYKKVDEHIKIRENLDERQEPLLLLEALHCFIEKEKKLCAGYSNGSKEPPKV